MFYFVGVENYSLSVW